MKEQQERWSVTHYLDHQLMSTDVESVYAMRGERSGQLRRDLYTTKSSFMHRQSQDKVDSQLNAKTSPIY
jgi:hypothetical protein